ncbi:hypothetical protein PPTG_22038 [Phytophthora nicotianae INRA-310]|uniref:Helix-turn-helix domain-containing protein n=2 Tax=Phytophthora nicotianae TaxID=4792 RepID=W2QRP6_PHYN3|nr:hypothetical protein PPTG_22038 [Phytophthora nicotianae INRA-310]ETN14930.1 hypothetical protein PPTG_22038 [Phytophthora nicotianae INRA-310]
MSGHLNGRLKCNNLLASMLDRIRSMEDAVTKQHAHPNTVLHCLYGFYNLGYSRKELARIYNKSDTTIGNWIRVYEASGTFERAGKSSERKFSAAHRS